MRRVISWSMPLAVALLLGGCATGVPPVPTIESLDAWRAYSDALDPRLGALGMRDSTWQMGDASSTYSIWSNDFGVLAMHEDMALGDYGDRRLRYYFRDGFLRYLREQGRVLIGGGAEAVTLQPLERELLYATDGQLLGWINRVGGDNARLEARVASGAREHALELLGVDVMPLAE